MPETSRFLRCYRSNNGNTRYSSNGSSLLKTAQTDPLSSPAEKLPQSFYLSQSPPQVLQDGPIFKEESEYSLKFNGTRSNSQNNPSNVLPPPSYRDGSKSFPSRKRTYDDESIVSSVSSPRSEYSPSHVSNFTPEQYNVCSHLTVDVKQESSAEKEGNKDVSFDPDMDVVEFYVDESSNNAQTALPAKMSLNDLVPLRKATSLVGNSIRHSLKTSDFDESDGDSSDTDSSSDDSSSSDSDSDDDHEESIPLQKVQKLAKPNGKNKNLPLTIYVPAAACLAKKKEMDGPVSKKKKKTGKKNKGPLYRSEGDNCGKKLINFVIDLLKDPFQQGKQVVKWENKEEGVFRILQSALVAKLWGLKKDNPKMTYEKFSRAMRYYYATNILVTFEKHGYPKKLVYKFGPAMNWRQA